MSQVVVADDSAVMINEVTSFLKGNGIETLIACNGQECFDLLKQKPSVPLAIVDINMPIMDGLTMIETVRRELPDCKTNFFVLTTEFDRKSKEKGRELGVKGWIIKPFKGDIVIATLKKYL